MRLLFLFLVVAVSCVVGMLFAEPKRPALPAKPLSPAAKATASAAAAAGREQDERAIRDVIARFTKAYNGGDANAIASLYTGDGEMIDETGQRLSGREAVEKDFASTFQEHPKAKISLDVASIRFLGPTLAVEEGLSTVTYDPDGPSESGRYVVTYVKQDGKWLTGSVRELSDDEEGVHALEQLGWLVGDWVDESPQALVKASYHWTDNHLFLVGEFALHISGRPAMNGTHRIGWDPLAKKIRSWVFDSVGGFSEALWTVSQTDATGAPQQWVVKMSGVTHTGDVGSATNVYTRMGDGRYMFQSRDRVIGGDMQDDTPDVVVVRAAPEPSKPSDTNE